MDVKIGRNGAMIHKSNIKYFVSLVVCLALSVSVLGYTPAEAAWPHITFSKDGAPISYEVFGAGEPTLVFVHGWSCDARYWRAQAPVFSKKHRVVVLDLAGHGHSGMSRAKYTMGSFGEDVRAVTESTNSQRVILIGHSMGGAVIAEAARLMPDRVIGLIGVDTLENIEYPLTKNEMEKMVAPMEKNFQEACRQFAGSMIADDTDPRLREWILADMSAAPPTVALSAMTEMLNQFLTGEAAKIFEQIKIPVIDVNGDRYPINYEANRRHMYSFKAIIVKDADHFLMMDRPVEFNKALEKAILMLTAK